MVVEGLVVSQAQSERRRQVLQEQHLVLGVGCQGIDVLFDVARRGGQVVLAPVGTDDGGGVGGQPKDAFQFALHRTLLLRLHVVADLVGLRLHIVFLAIAETVDGEVGLQRVAIVELIDAAEVPAQALVAHLVVSTTRDVLSCLRAVCDLV